MRAAAQVSQPALQTDSPGALAHHISRKSGAPSDPALVGSFEPVIDLPLGFVLRDAIALLQLSGEFRAFTLHDIQIVVGELAPLLLQIPLELLPVTFNAIPIHITLLYSNDYERNELGLGKFHAFVSTLPDSDTTAGRPAMTINTANSHPGETL
ncbi:hypothetical protein CHELA1G11_10725 [Hyphomicrobiales bacterium]|nr:hypothetical protein CHELA1G11_10725 [Hyphomicrobiales bacterium]CAH1672669.1 hypothetical protein CHELA1G2_13579 [Hyphomicrobiales bacterium]